MSLPSRSRRRTSGTNSWTLSHRGPAIRGIDVVDESRKIEFETGSVSEIRIEAEERRTHPGFGLI